MKNKQVASGLKDFLRLLNNPSNKIFSESTYYTTTHKDFFLTDNLSHLQNCLSKSVVNERIEGNPALLSNLVNAQSNNGIISAREEMANELSRNFNIVYSKAMELYTPLFCEQALSPDFSVTNLSSAYDILTSVVSESIVPSSKASASKWLDYERTEEILTLFKKSILYLFHKKEYPQAFWWLSVFCILQDKIVLLSSHYPETQYTKFYSLISNETPNHKEFLRSNQLTIQENFFWKLRKKAILSAKGTLFIAGPSLREAFNATHARSLIPSLQEALTNRQLNEIHIFLTDPREFAIPAPMRDIDEAVECLQENLYDLAERVSCQLHLYFLELSQIDHAVITDEIMLFRSNKLWNHDRKFKGSFTLNGADYYCPKEASEYAAQREYLEMLSHYSTSIYPAWDIPKHPPQYASADWYHYTWRGHLQNKGYSFIYLHKIYRSQPTRYAAHSWVSDTKTPSFNPSDYPRSAIGEVKDCFDSKNLLGDKTQEVLLRHLEGTRALFDQTIKKYGSDFNNYCQIFPSLDLGFPNNVQRLAGGFATGILVTWKCGVDIVPVDATVNVCTSSVFKLNRETLPKAWFDPVTGTQSFYDYVNKLSGKASTQKGYSFSFNSGNHFLILAKDSITDEYYLVLHSSANELKKSYMGLYPVEGNWYADRIKHTYNQNQTRYFRYLKDEDARYFIRMAHNFEGYNEQMHQWVAEQFNGGQPLCRENDNENRWLYHHYYMPTDSSIAIGSFAESVGTQVPIFSEPGKPLYIFEIGKNNWSIDLGGKKGRVCLVPHGWGQEIREIRSIAVENSTDIENRQLVLTYGETEESSVSFPVKSSERIKCPGKQIRSFKDGEEFLSIGNRYLHGTIRKTLVPVFEYSSKTQPSNTDTESSD